MSKEGSEIQCDEFNKIKENINKKLESLFKDAHKFYDKNNETAGVRLRKGYKEIRNYVSEIIDETLKK